MVCQNYDIMLQKFEISGKLKFLKILDKNVAVSSPSIPMVMLKISLEKLSDCSALSRIWYTTGSITPINYDLTKSPKSNKCRPETLKYL